MKVTEGNRKGFSRIQEKATSFKEIKGRGGGKNETKVSIIKKATSKKGLIYPTFFQKREEKEKRQAKKKRCRAAMLSLIRKKEIRPKDKAARKAKRRKNEGTGRSQGPRWIQNLKVYVGGR